MSWMREHVETMLELQLKTQRLIEAAGTNAPGVDWLIEVNECLTAALGFASLQVERHERGIPRLIHRPRMALCDESCTHEEPRP
jgi:hypothetical protein